MAINKHLKENCQILFDTTCFYNCYVYVPFKDVNKSSQ